MRGLIRSSGNDLEYNAQHLRQWLEKRGLGHHQVA